MKKQRCGGFTLVEIMIVVAIIVLLAAISIPSMLRVRLDANEAAAISTMRALSGAAQSYRIDNGRYPIKSIELGPPGAGGGSAYCAAQPGYIDSQLACQHWGEGCHKQGYYFQILQRPVADAVNGFNAIGSPAVYRLTGVRSFLVDESGVIRYTTFSTSFPYTMNASNTQSLD